MSREFRLPDLGSGLKEGRVLRWCVAVGDQVTTDGILCELETEKAVIEVPVPFDGVVLELAAEEDETVAVGGILVRIGGADEGAPTTASTPATSPAPTPPVEPAPAPPVAGAVVAAAGDPVRAMPSIRRLARRHGIDLRTIRGTGKLGRITRSDLEAVIARSAPVAAAAAPLATPRLDRREKLSMLRKSLSANLTRSWQEVPHVFTRLKVDAGAVLEARAALSDQLGRKVPIEALLIRAVTPVLQELPQFNATIDGDEIVLQGRCDIGVAVDTDDGLIVPVVRSADGLSLRDLVDNLSGLIERTAKRRATPDELTGATFTINNIGAGGPLMGTSVIPYGTTAILSVGQAEKKAVVRDDAIVIRPMMEVSLSFDHRAIDGGHAQRFMERVRLHLEQPVRVLAV